jgi:putative protein-disulfide isomerase
MDSEPPIAAMLAAEMVASKGLDLLARMQVAHYVEGRRIADRPVLQDLAVAIGLDGAAFAQALGEVEGEAVQGHILQTRALMQRLGLGGFPSFVLERDGRWTPVEFGSYLGQPAPWADWLRLQVPEGSRIAAAIQPQFACGPDGCRI